MNDNYLQVRNPQDLKKIANINLAIDKAYDESNYYVPPKELQAIKDFIIKKSIFDSYEEKENLNQKDNYYFSKNVFEMVKKYPWKVLKNEFSNIKNIFEEADDKLKFKLSDIILNGPENVLKLTQNTQPAILTVSHSIFSVLKD